MLENTKDSSIIAERKGSVALITLNRPQALNALTHEMILDISARLTAWESDPSVKAIFFLGAGDRAFCAGGDIKHAYRQGLAYKETARPENNPTQYFFDEYNLNRQLYHYKKPLFAFMDGVTMGGGFGIAGPCDYRVATEKTVFAMPEVGIGFFPDIGGAYYLQQAPHHIGAYLCLTGSSINGSEMLYAGVATHFITSAKLDKTIEILIDAIQNDQSVENALNNNDFACDDVLALKDHKEIIRDHFASNDVGQIVSELLSSGDDWARTVGEVMRSRSPLSLEITMKHLQIAKKQSFDDVIARDFVLAQNFLREQDFYEGVRAAVIDKDRAPKWQHQSLAAVSDKEVDSYFKDAERSLY